MITKALSNKKIAEMKQIYAAYRPALRPNRKSGVQVDDYFRSQNPCQPLENDAFRAAVAANAKENAPGMFLGGTQPDVRCYCVGDVWIGIDLISGAFHVEAKRIAAAVPIYDDLFAFRGLDEKDLQYFVLVAEYVQCRRKNHV